MVVKVTACHLDVSSCKKKRLKFTKKLQWCVETSITQIALDDDNPINYDDNHES